MVTCHNKAIKNNKIVYKVSHVHFELCLSIIYNCIQFIHKKNILTARQLNFLLAECAENSNINHLAKNFQRGFSHQNLHENCSRGETINSEMKPLFFYQRVAVNSARKKKQHLKKKNIKTGQDVNKYLEYIKLP